MPSCFPVQIKLEKENACSVEDGNHIVFRFHICTSYTMAAQVSKEQKYSALVYWAEWPHGTGFDEDFAGAA